MTDELCPHPDASVTWQHKGPNGVVAVIDGLLHGVCDDCGTHVSKVVNLAAMERWHHTVSPLVERVKGSENFPQNPPVKENNQ